MLSLRLIDASWKMIISNDVVERKSEKLRRLKIIKCNVLLCENCEPWLNEEVQALRFGSVGLLSLQSIEEAPPFSAHGNEGMNSREHPRWF
jgi:hypothetical protein